MNPTTEKARRCRESGSRTPAEANIVIQGSTYLVDLGVGQAPRYHRVNKTRQCSCGAKECEAVAAVREYLCAGGQRAPDVHGLPPCPICGSEVTRDRVWDGRYTGEPGWRCTRGGLLHFLQDKAQRIQQNFEQHPWLIPPAPDYPGVRRDELMTWQECQADNYRIFVETGYDPTR